MEFETGYAGRRVLVTGANGFIGEHLSRELNHQGAEVFGTDRISPPGAPPIRWIRMDLTDHEATRSLIRETAPDVVFHLASHVAGRREPELVLPTFHSNLVTTVHLLSAVQETGCRRIVLSNSMEEPTPGDRWVVPASPYAAAKFAASSYGRMFHALYGLPVVIARIFMVYGPAQKDLTKLVPYVILKLLRNEAPMLSSGQRTVDWIYVEDVTRGLLALGSRTGIDGQTIDLGTGVMHSVREVVEELQAIIDPALQVEFGSLADRKMEQEPFADVERTYQRTGWRAEFPLRRGLEQTVEWYRSELERPRAGG